MIKDTLIALKSATHFVFLLRKQAVKEMDVSRRSVYLSLFVATTCSLSLDLFDKYWHPNPDYTFLSDSKGWLSLTVFLLFKFFAGIVVLTICTHLLGFQQHLAKLIVTGNWVGIILGPVSMVPYVLFDEWWASMLDANVMMYGIAALFVLTPFFCIDIYRIVIVINERVRHGLLLWACQFFGDIVVFVLGFTILLDALF